MEKYSDEQVSSANKELERRLSQDRVEWKEKITNLVSELREVRKLSESQVMMLSYRQMLLDKIGEFKNTVYKRKMSWDRYYKTKFRDYTLSYDIKLTGGERHQFISTDLAPLKLQINMLESHIEYYQECIRTLDNMAFAIRNRIRLEDDM